jgi:hypothetical protein
MLRIITPDLLLDSVHDLDVGRLRELELDSLLLDVDCTLKDYPATAFSSRTVAWINDLRANGVRLCLLSNGRSCRIERLARQLELPFIAGACKPFPFGCLAAVKRLGSDPRRTAMVGDQLFADVMAGRFAGLFTILVAPIRPEEEPWFTRLKRPLERVLLQSLKRRAASRTGAAAGRSEPVPSGTEAGRLSLHFDCNPVWYRS